MMKSFIQKIKNMISGRNKSYSLERFHKAQKCKYDDALSEIKSGQKASHWMWYIFPQVKGLGFSDMSVYFGIDGIDEAKAYLNDPILKERLIEISTALLDLDTNDPIEVMGYPDNLKLQSSMTLFHLADPEEAVFSQVLEKYFSGDADQETIRIVNSTL